MKEDLKECIDNWKKIQSNHKETRMVTVEKSKLEEAEFDLSLKMSVRVVDMSRSENVSVTRKIKTAVQSSPTALGREDVEQFRKAMQQLEKDFAAKCGSTYERLSRQSNQGDVERNPYS